MRGHPAITYIALVFDRDGGNAGTLPAVCRPTKHNGGHSTAIVHQLSTRMVEADMFPDVRGRTWHTLRVLRTRRT
eukprot:2195892-Pyramimonas_sp.AAC.1